MANHKRLIGRFFFQKTDNKNLIGEFSNSPGDGVSTESSDFMEPCENKENANCKWHGTYHSSWQEDAVPLFAELKIFRKIGSANLFSLEWCRNNNPPTHKELIFVGEGMLCNGMLIGDYREPSRAEKDTHLQANQQPIT